MFFCSGIICSISFRLISTKKFESMNRLEMTWFFFWKSMYCIIGRKTDEKKQKAFLLSSPPGRLGKELKPNNFHAVCTHVNRQHVIHERGLTYWPIKWIWCLISHPNNRRRTITRRTSFRREYLASQILNLPDCKSFLQFKKSDVQTQFHYQFLFSTNPEKWRIQIERCTQSTCVCIRH